MTKREIASLAIKLMGIFILLRSISYAPMIFGNAFQVGAGLLATVMYIFMCIIALAWGVFIIVFSDRIAKWLIKDDHPIELPGSVRKEDVMVVVFTCIGLYLIVTAIPSLIVYFSNFLMFHKARSGVSYSGGFHDAFRLIAPVVQIGLGIWLFAGSRGLVKLWQKIRS